MKSVAVLAVTAVVALGGFGGYAAHAAYAAQPASPATSHSRTTSGPVDHEARDLAKHKATSSQVGERQRAAERAAARKAAAQTPEHVANGRADTPAERACVGHEAEARCDGVEQGDVPNNQRQQPHNTQVQPRPHHIGGNGKSSGETQLEWLKKKGLA